MKERYSRQLPQIGEKGQEKISRSSIALVGCGALGCVFAMLAARMGVGRVRLIDRDIVEEHNLPRQILFDEKDAKQGLPKALAAKEKLLSINSRLKVEAFVEDLDAFNGKRLLQGVDLVLDGTDNFQTRYVVNDVCLEQGIPWVYAGVIATYGHVMPVIPQGPCFRCYLEEPPLAGQGESCELEGVLATAVLITASFAFQEGLKILLGRSPLLGLTLLHLFDGEVRRLVVPKQKDCPSCGTREFPSLSQKRGSAEVLCGRNAIQIRLGEVDWQRLCEKVRRIGTEVREAPFVIHFYHGELRGTLFQDGRLLLQGTSDPRVARSFVAKYLGI